MTTIMVPAPWIGAILVAALALGPRPAGVPAQEGPGLPPPPVNPGMSAPALRDALDGYVTSLAREGRFAGVVLVARDGKVVFERACGLADRERGTAITPAHRFNLASIGKAFTKVAIGQLIAAGKLALSDTIGKRLPEYPTAAARAATVDQLLNHSGGIVDFFGPRFDAAPKEQFGSNADYFRFVASAPLLFPPGTRRQYCNGCYIVLGEITAAVSGMPYERYVSERIFAPAGMSGAGFLSYGDPDVATGYTGRGGALQPNGAMHGRRGSAAGGSFARASDLLAFDNALRERRLLDGAMTAWYLETEPVEQGRTPGAYGIAGGAPGSNASLEASGTWTVAVVGNLDPPNASRLAIAIMRTLGRP